MTLKEELLSIQTYEEFDKKRERFKDIEIDDDIRKHLSEKIFHRVELFEGDALRRKENNNTVSSGGPERR